MNHFLKVMRLNDYLPAVAHKASGDSQNQDDPHVLPAGGRLEVEPGHPVPVRDEDDAQEEPGHQE